MIPSLVRTRVEKKILFHAAEHVAAARDQTSEEESDFKQVADLATPRERLDHFRSAASLLHDEIRR